MTFKNPHYEGAPITPVLKDKKQITIPPNALNIVWGGDSRYWKIPKNPDLPAELLQVSWLEVTGSVDGTDPKKSYEVGFTISLTPDAFGWSGLPIYIMVKRGKGGKFAWKRLFLNPRGTEKFYITGKLMKTERSSRDSTDEQNKIYFGLYEVWSGKWKGGLQIHQAFVREA